MKIKRNVMIASAVALTVAGGGAATAMAASSNSTAEPSLASEIAQKFNIDQFQVQSVIDQHRTEVRQNREKSYEQRLDNAVSQGKLTAVQKQAVLNEHNKLVDTVQSASKSEKRQTLKSVRQEAKTWASQNKIAVSWLLPLRGISDNSAVNRS